MEIMNTAKFTEIMEKIEACVEQYEKAYGSNRYTISLASGDILNVMISPNSIAHLLGVNLDYLKLSNKFKPDMNSYEKLKFFLSERYLFQKLVSEKKLCYQSMFSPYIESKLDCFYTNTNIRINNMYCVIKYDSERTFKIDVNSDISDYYIIRNINNSYYVLGLVKNDNGNYNYNATSSRMYSDQESFENFLARIAKKQELTYPYHFLLQNPSSMFESKMTVYDDDKYDIVSNILQLAKKYDAVPNTSSDFLHTIGRSKNNRSTSINNYSVLRLLSDYVKSGKVLDIETITEICGGGGAISLPTDIVNLINTCNDVLCSDIDRTNSSIQYSELEKQNISMKETLDNIRKDIIDYQDKIEQLEKQNVRLQSDYDLQNQKIKIYTDAYEAAQKIGL